MSAAWHKVPRTKKYKAFKLMAIINMTLLVVNLFSFVFISQPRQAPVKAQKEELLCLRICPNGTPSCDFGPCAVPATVTTDGISSITQTTATASGTVTSDGGDAIIERGFVISTSSSPTILDDKYAVSGTTGSFNYTFTGLTTSTLYYFRAYASNTIALSYGVTTQFTTLSPDEEPAEEEEPAEDFGGLPQPPFLTPSQLQEYLIPEPPVKDRTTVRLDNIIDTAGNRTGLFLEVPNDGLVGYFNAFEGVTNIKDAVVVLSLSEISYRGTLRADERGAFVWLLPQSLEPGAYIATVQAFSPYNAALNTAAQYILNIRHPETEVLPPPVIPPDIEDIIPPPPVLPPPQPPISRVGDLYIMNTSVLEPQEGLVQTSQLDIRTYIESLDPDSQEAFQLVFRIYDSNGHKLYQFAKDINVKGKLIDTSRAITSYDLLPGDYLLATELQRGDLRYVATHVFTIVQPSFSFTPALTIPVAGLQAGLLISAFILYLLLLFLIYLMYREYKRAKKSLQHITGKDLLEKGMIS